MNRKKNTSPTNGSTSTKSQRIQVLEPVNCPSVGAKTNGSSGCTSALDEDAAPAGPAAPAGRSSRAAMVAYRISGRYLVSSVDLLEIGHMEETEHSIKCVVHGLQ